MPAGNGSKQAIEEEKRVDIGAEVLLEISRGREKGVVPMKVGIAQEMGVELMEQAEGRGMIKEVSRSNMAPGAVVTQSIERNTTAVKGDKINLTVAKDDGKGDVSVMVKVPDMVGENYEETQNGLQSDYLYLMPASEYSDTGTEGLTL